MVATVLGEHALKKLLKRSMSDTRISKERLQLLGEQYLACVVTMGSPKFSFPIGGKGKGSGLKGKGKGKGPPDTHHTHCKTAGS